MNRTSAYCHFQELVDWELHSEGVLLSELGTCQEYNTEIF
jgi:hypothetical protein